MATDVIIPWRGGCEHRQAARDWVTARYAEQHPDWTVIVGLAPRGPWVKALAVEAALKHSIADVVVIADADVWVEEFAEAVDLVEAGAPWAVPHRLVKRLTPAATGDVLLRGEPFRDELVQRPYIGHPGGGLVVLRRELYDDCPLDPRFVGWGGEDDSWGHALKVLAGPARRLPHTLWHFWHPPQERRSRSVGSVENTALMRRYVRTHNPEQMRALLAEARQEVCA